MVNKFHRCSLSIFQFRAAKITAAGANVPLAPILVTAPNMSRSTYSFFVP